MRIQFLRGLEADRGTKTLLDGEIFISTDTKKTFIGDGITPGGVLISNPFDDNNVSQLEKLWNIQQHSKEPTGFNRNDLNTVGQISIDPNLLFTIEPKTGEDNFSFWVKGEYFEKDTATTIQLDNTYSGMQFLYFDDNGDIQAIKTFDEDIIIEWALIAVVYFNASQNKILIFGDERHGKEMNGFMHLYLHQTEGTRFDGGMMPDLVEDATTLGLGGIGSGKAWDEDLIHEPLTQTSFRIFYRKGIHWECTPSIQNLSLYYVDPDTIDYTDETSQYPAYNYFNETSSVWEQATAGNNDFCLYHIMYTNDINEPYVCIQGQNGYDSASLAREGALVEINNLKLDGLPSPEFVFIATYIIDENRMIELTEDGDAWIDWRTSKLSGGKGATAVSHSSLTNLDTSGHPSNVISYDNTESGLEATNTKEAIDKLHLYPRTCMQKVDNSIFLSSTTHVQIEGFDLGHVVGNISNDLLNGKITLLEDGFYKLNIFIDFYIDTASANEVGLEIALYVDDVEQQVHGHGLVTKDVDLNSFSMSFSGERSAGEVVDIRHKETISNLNMSLKSICFSIDRVI